MLFGLAFPVTLMLDVIRNIALIASLALFAGCENRLIPDGSIYSGEIEFNGKYSGNAEVIISNTVGLSSPGAFGLLSRASNDDHCVNVNDIELQLNNGLLKIIDLANNITVELKYKYANGRIEIETRSSYMIYLIVNGSKSRSITLSMNKDNDIMIDDNFYSVGWFLIFPQGYCKNDIYLVKRR
jgi:hypothetical protein